jgi:DMSO/TMAO reductase YedYZ heme-binding membrane subunit
MVWTPSFLAHIGNALFLLLAAFLFFKNYASIKKTNGLILVALTLLASIAIGIHGLSHLGLEQRYNYNLLA